MATRKNTPAVEKPKTEIVSSEKNIKEVLKEAVGTVVIISKETTEKKLKTLVKTLGKEISLLIDIPKLDKKQVTLLTKYRAELRENRYALQNVGKHNASVLSTARKNNGLMLDELIAIVKPLEEIADTKITAEEDRAKEEKRLADEEEEKRVQDIEDRINNAATFFEAELERARKNNDWLEFDKYYLHFEESVEELQELEFEGVELLEKYAGRKKEIVDLITQAAEQAEKDLELAGKEKELNAEKEKIAEDQRRMFELFGLGFNFNGKEYFKEEVKYLQTEIAEKNKEDFDALVGSIKKEALAVIEYNDLIEEAKGLNLEVSGYKGVLDSEKVKKVLEDAKIAKTAEEAETERVAKELAAESLKKTGSIVCWSISEHIKMMEDAVAPSGLVNEKAKEITTAFFISIKQQYKMLSEGFGLPKEEE